MRAAVLGSPVAHSLSPALHLAAYRALGLSGWSYRAIECDAARLPGLLAGCGPDWAGLSLTMPLKRAVLPLLDQAEPLVTEVGAANTVIFANGARQGHNTDVAGIAAALSGTAGAAGAAWTAGSAQRPALILGGGATACSALAALRGLGAGGATVAVRDAATADGLLAAADRLGVRVRLTPFGQEDQIGAGQLVISTVPAGAADSYAKRIARTAAAPAVLLDVVYHPWPTPLAAAAGAAGAVVISGLEMLLHQAAGQVTLMTGRAAPVAAMRSAGLAGLGGQTPTPAGEASRRPK
jgi:shikimate dehydrogenase